MPLQLLQVGTPLVRPVTQYHKKKIKVVGIDKCVLDYIDTFH